MKRNNNKKKIMLTLVYAGLFGLTATSCSQPTTETTTETTETTETTGTEETTQTEGTEVTEDGNEQTSEEAEDSKEIPVELKKPIVTDTKEITIKKIEFSYDVLPDESDNTMQYHYPASEGKVYVHADIDVKNLAKQSLQADSVISMEVDYNDGFKYSAFSIVEDDTLGFTYSDLVSIDPLTTEGIRLLAECPEEVESSGNPVIVRFNIEDKVYSYTLVK